MLTIFSFHSIRIFILSLCLLVALTASAPLSSSSSAFPTKSPNDACEECLKIDPFLEELQKKALYVVAHDCAVICEKLVPHGNIYAKLICAAACLYAGPIEFLEALRAAEKDVVWFCDEIRMCSKHSDCPSSSCGSFVSKFEYPKTVVVVNQTKPQPQPYHFDTTFLANYQTATAQILLEFIDPEADPGIVQAETHYFVPGGFKKGIKVPVSLEMTFVETELQDWYAGDWYDVRLRVCEGECNSKKAGTRILAEVHGNMTVTEG